MRELNYQLKCLGRHAREGSYATQANRERVLSQIADQLHALGFRQMGAKSLKPKHVEALVKAWQEQGLAVGTIKNRMSALRWWAEKIGKRSAVASSNTHYGIPDREFVGAESKAKSLGADQLDQIKDVHVRMSLRLQDAFGLRREEALKIRPRQADQGDRLELQASWTKGGRARTVPIRTDAQRQLLEEAKALAGFESLIPRGRLYIQQLRIYERHTANAGLSKMHGLRHAYAQRRYEELTGWKAPLAGGPSSQQLNSDQRQIDHRARLIVSEELGHSRGQVTSVYLGR